MAQCLHWPRKGLMELNKCITTDTAVCFHKGPRVGPSANAGCISGSQSPGRVKFFQPTWLYMPSSSQLGLEARRSTSETLLATCLLSLGLTALPLQVPKFNKARSLEKKGKGVLQQTIIEIGSRAPHTTLHPAKPQRVPSEPFAGFNFSGAASAGGH